MITIQGIPEEKLPVEEIPTLKDLYQWAPYPTIIALLTAIIVEINYDPKSSIVLMILCYRRYLLPYNNFRKLSASVREELRVPEESPFQENHHSEEC
ncbi:hypothetical protein HHI36_004890 [Cryptolaemus montrouzieri]|uniref:Uncharacterized protein n=1 Tax=Cryptolaemus montrouzieri TaxID=559131 RepID=A0ABD2NST4_9CUCU